MLDPYQWKIRGKIPKTRIPEVMGATTSKAHNVMMLWALSSGTVKLKISLILDMVRWSHLFPAIQGLVAGDVAEEEFNAWMARRELPPLSKRVQEIYDMREKKRRC